MTNLLRETVEMLAAEGLTPDDVRWVGTPDAWCTWAEFAAVANVEYDSGYGGQEVQETLKVVGDDWWLERHEYDGSEWWEMKRRPVKPETHKVPGTVINCGRWEKDEVCL